MKEAHRFFREVFHLEDEELLQKLAENAGYRAFQKGEQILREGERQDQLYLLDSGIVRGYFLNMEGEDITECFVYRRGVAACPFTHLGINEPAPHNMEMMESGGFFFLPKTFVGLLLAESMEIQRIYNQMLIQALDEQSKLKQMLGRSSAMERYQWFLRTYPGLVGRISNRYIASFLGMTAVTLSRLRKNLREEKMRKINTGKCKEGNGLI